MLQLLCKRDPASEERGRSCAYYILRDGKTLVQASENYDYVVLRYAPALFTTPLTLIWIWIS